MEVAVWILAIVATISFIGFLYYLDAANKARALHKHEAERSEHLSRRLDDEVTRHAKALDGARETSAKELKALAEGRNELREVIYLFADIYPGLSEVFFSPAYRARDSKTGDLMDGPRWLDMEKVALYRKGQESHEEFLEFVEMKRQLAKHSAEEES